MFSGGFSGTFHGMCSSVYSYLYMKAVHPATVTLHLIICWAAQVLQGQTNTFPLTLKLPIISTSFIRKVNILPNWWRWSSWERNISFCWRDPVVGGLTWVLPPAWTWALVMNYLLCHHKKTIIQSLRKVLFKMCTHHWIPVQKSYQSMRRISVKVLLYLVFFFFLSLSLNPPLKHPLL